MGSDCRGSYQAMRNDNNCNSDYENDYENDDLYVEIRRQITMLLTAEQGEEESESNQRRRGRKVPPGRGGVMQVAPAGRYFSWCEGGSNGFGDSFPTSSSSSLSSSSASPPDWLLDLWRSNQNRGGGGGSSTVGTGVFIPQIGKCRGRNISRRRKSEGNRMNKKPLQNLYN